MMSHVLLCMILVPFSLLLPNGASPGGAFNHLIASSSGMGGRGVHNSPASFLLAAWMICPNSTSAGFIRLRGGFGDSGGRASKKQTGKRAHTKRSKHGDARDSGGEDARQCFSFSQLLILAPTDCALAAALKLKLSAYR